MPQKYDKRPERDELNNTEMGPAEIVCSIYEDSE